MPCSASSRAPRPARRAPGFHALPRHAQNPVLGGPTPCRGEERRIDWSRCARRSIPGFPADEANETTSPRFSATYCLRPMVDFADEVIRSSRGEIGEIGAVAAAGAARGHTPLPACAGVSATPIAGSPWMTLHAVRPDPGTAIVRLQLCVSVPLRKGSDNSRIRREFAFDALAVAGEHGSSGSSSAGVGVPADPDPNGVQNFRDLSVRVQPDSIKAKFAEGDLLKAVVDSVYAVKQ